MKTLFCSIDRLSQANRSGAGGPRVAEHVGDGAVGRARVLQARESPEHEPGREADLGDEHDQAEEQRPVPLPTVERDDHVGRAQHEGGDTGDPSDDLHPDSSSCDVDLAALAVDAHDRSFGEIVRRARVADDGRDVRFAGEDGEMRQHRAGLRRPCP